MGMDIIEGKGNIDSTFLSKFTKLDTITCKVSDLSFYKYGIGIDKIDSNNYLIDDIMLIGDKSVLEEFYYQLWVQLTPEEKNVHKSLMRVTYL